MSAYVCRHGATKAEGEDCDDMRDHYGTHPSPATETPGPGEGDLRPAPGVYQGSNGAQLVVPGDPSWLMAQLARTQAERDAAVEQRTLAEQRVARVAALCQTGVFDVRDWGERGTPFSNGALRMISRVRAALADPEADR